jgi:hypothetical protein
MEKLFGSHLTADVICVITGFTLRRFTHLPAKALLVIRFAITGILASLAIKN